MSNYFCHDISLSQNSYFMVMDNFSTIFVDKCPICQSKIIFIQKRPKSKLRNGTHKMKTHCNGDLRPKIVAMHVSAWQKFLFSNVCSNKYSICQYQYELFDHHLNYLNIKIKIKILQILFYMYNTEEVSWICKWIRRQEISICQFAYISKL